MPETKDKSERDAFLRPPVQTIALGLAAIGISLGAFCFALVSVFSSQARAAAIISWSPWIAVLLAVAGMLSLVASAFLIDWTIDAFQMETWDEVNRVAQSMNSKFPLSGVPINSDKDKKFADSRSSSSLWGSFVARVRLFGGGYLLLALAVSVLIFLLIWIVPTHFPVPLELRVLLAIVGGVLAALVFFKMMTRRLPTATCLILGWMIISGALLGLVVHLFGR